MIEMPFAGLTAEKFKLTNQVNGEGSNPVEGIMCGSGPQESQPQGSKLIQTCGPNLSSDEEYGEDCPWLPPHPGDSVTGPAAIRISTWHRGG